MEKKISQSDATDFIKRLVELGGLYKVNTDNLIVGKRDNQPIQIHTSKTKSQPCMILHDKMQMGEHTVLNPFVETLTKSPERDWFFQSKSILLGTVVKRLMVAVIETAISGKETEYEKIPLISPFLKQIDEKMLEEVNTLPAADMLFIEFNKKARTATLLTCMYDSDYVAKFGKIRKKTWEVVRGLLEAFLECDALSETYTHKSTIIGLQEADAVLHVLIKAYMSLDQYIKLMLNEDPDVAALVQHLENLEKYYKICAWCVTSSSAQDEEVVTPPWPTAPNLIPTQPLPQAMPVMPVDNMPMLVPSASLPSAGHAPLPIMGTMPPAVGMPMPYSPPAYQPAMHSYPYAPTTYYGGRSYAPPSVPMNSGLPWGAVGGLLPGVAYTSY